jgi:hypothetical protein
MNNGAVAVAQAPPTNMLGIESQMLGYPHHANEQRQHAHHQQAPKESAGQRDASLEGLPRAQILEHQGGNGDAVTHQENDQQNSCDDEPNEEPQSQQDGDPQQGPRQVAH